MQAKALMVALAGLWFFAFSFPASGQKLRFASAIKENPAYYLTVLAAEEKGFWKENGLEVTWVPFIAATPMHRAAAAKEVLIGLDTAIGITQVASRGVPVAIVSDLDRAEGFILWVMAKSPVREPKELKGRIGVIALGAAGHAYAQVAAKSLGIEKQVRFVGAGGVPSMVAALKAGSLDATVTSFFNLMDLKFKGEVRDLFSMDDYLPKPWTGRIVWAHKEFQKSSPDTVRRTVKAILQATRFWKGDSSWAVAKIMAQGAMAEGPARAIYEIMRPSEDGKIDKKALENVIGLLIEYGLVAKEKALAIEELYTGEFVSGS